MPARRATAKASPLGRFASRINVWAESSTRQEASARRRVTGFSETSTMWALPWGSRWLKEPCELIGGRAPRERIRGHASILAILSPMRLAIVVPTLDEEDTVRRYLPAALAAADEVVVSDGGSADRTVEVARSLGARVVTGPPGRGVQLNRGARAAIESKADVLLFLHADTTLPPGGAEAVRAAAAQGAPGGAFFLRFDADLPLQRLGSWLVNLRTRWLRVPLGDQAQW